jgi:hypothetical protein
MVWVLAVAPAAAQAPGDTARYESKQYHYAVALPAGCRREEGPGTIDAVCAPDFDPEKSAVAGAANALVLGVAAEAVKGEGDTSASGLLQRFTEAGFREELPETVCGESDKARVKIENVNQVVEDNTRVVYSADVVCADVRFLQIGERRASVRTVIGPDVVYRLVARAPAEVFAQQRAPIDAFLASFRVISATVAHDR